MPDPRLVIWDVDGTLVDSRAAITRAMRIAFDAAGLAYPGDAPVLARVGLSLEAMLSGLVAPAARIETLAAAYRAAYRARREALGDAADSPFYDDMAAALAQVQALPDTRMAIATGKSRRGVEAMLSGHGLRDWFASVQCADDHPGKPDPAMLHAALAETGIAPGRAVMIGDTTFDMEMGRAAGVFTLGVGWGYHPPDRLVADRIARTPADIVPAVRMLTGETQ